jgi:hypothetical protein
MNSNEQILHGNPVPRHSRGENWLYLSGLFLLLLAGKLWLIGHFGNATPFWDQWGAEGDNVYVPYLENRLTPASLFDSHCEHRIFFTRVLGLGLFKLNGIWDPKLEMVVQAFLHVGCITLLVALCGRHLPSSLARLLFGIFTAVIFVLPFGWENTLWGFQSQFYFVSLWGLIGIACCWRYATLSCGWWLGVFVLSLGLISMAGGVLAPVVAGGLVVLRAIRNRRDWLRQAVGALVLGMVAGLGFLLIRHIPEHDCLKAHNPAQFISALFHIGSWPSHFFAPLIQCPLVFLIVWTFRQRRPADDPAWLLIALGLWGWAQSAAIAYGRAVGWSTSRYTDTFSVTLCFQFACLLYLLAMTDGRLRRYCMALCAVWAGVVGGRLIYVAVRHLPKAIAAKYDLSRIEESHVRAYLDSHDFAELKNTTFLQIPSPDPAALAADLEQPSLREILPTNLRASLKPIHIAADPAGSFRPDGYRPGTAGLSYQSVWGSYNPAKGSGSKGAIEMRFGPGGRTSWLEIEWASTPHAHSVSLHIIDETNRDHAISPPSGLGTQWQSVRFSRPSGPFTMRVAVASPEDWAAFTLPREIGPLSIAADFLESQAVLLAILGAALAGCAEWKVRARPDGTAGCSS